MNGIVCLGHNASTDLSSWGMTEAFTHFFQQENILELSSLSSAKGCWYSNLKNYITDWKTNLMYYQEATLFGFSQHHLPYITVFNIKQFSLLLELSGSYEDPVLLST